MDKEKKPDKPLYLRILKAILEAALDELVKGLVKRLFPE
jgi:hypothetical protein